MTLEELIKQYELGLVKLGAQPNTTENKTLRIYIQQVVRDFKSVAYGTQKENICLRKELDVAKKDTAYWRHQKGLEIAKREEIEKELIKERAANANLLRELENVERERDAIKTNYDDIRRAMKDNVDRDERIRELRTTIGKMRGKFHEIYSLIEGELK